MRTDRGYSSRIVVATILVTAVLGSCSSGSSKSAANHASSTTNASAASATVKSARGPSIIIDTDFSRWWDDVTAIGSANVLQRQSAAHVLGIVSDVPNPVAVAAI